ncbi:preprotein translocase subunit SecA [Tessaracoccus sp. OH4464_COT-324]|uniref:preprotein translocase subunit SecA n=1 Tax=Tessaracoccus sp. OH4464_COT-324 TaxID=2491059 RepID=UPI000F63CF48|nr:preprotein translocase subunit SecA [Tessaracoccus sp. OH4464_COT-324]RRD47569.1 preprotein translocase subunit SecA [Tessaracoccus sp. OH4464_COT-324]
MDFLSGIGTGSQLKKLQKVADRVNMIEEDFRAFSDAELKEETAKFRQRFADGESLDSLMPEAFAVVREASVRVTGKRHFDVQIMGGAALHWGNIAEMKTGEGKTLVGTLPSYLNALDGKGVHIVTTNDYLAKYQSEQMGRIHHFLGLRVGAILAQMTPDQRRDAYAADITYGTNNEFGFDYLRDNMALRKEDMVQRGHHYAIVDEVDSILIDEARTPLIISGPAQDSKEWFPFFARMARTLQRDVDYEVDEKKRTIAILAPGIEKVEDRLGIDNLYESANTPLVSYLNNSIKAKELFKRDKDYVVAGEEVLIVDEHTGRTLEGRRYSDGLHQSLEAKEGVRIKDEFQTLATITLQNYFRMYDKLAGMTGTAKTEESEFQKIYGLGVIPIPTNRPMIRLDQPDLVYRTEEAKFRAIITDVVARHEKGQPVLIGTASVEKSELLSEMLKRANVPHTVLNAKYHEREAAIVAEAGRKGAVTVSTNMAGRGTDIMLGGNPEFLADLQLRKDGLDPVESPDEYEERWPDTLKALEEQVASEHDEVKDAGGLYVIGSERHESRRIDNQLRGRSGRQGDPGESRFYLSLADDLMRLFRPELLERAMVMLDVPEDSPIESKAVSKQIEGAQKQVESQNFEMRKNVLKYDDVMNRQRHAIYGDRRRVLDGADVSKSLRATAERMVTDVVTNHTTGFEEDWDLDQMLTELRTLYPTGITLRELEKDLPTQAEMVDMFVTDIAEAYSNRESELGEERMRELERQVLLTVLDRKWREHLYEMDYLREGIGLRAMAQRDPLTEYQREGGDMFNAMMGAFMEEVIGYLFHLEIPNEEPEAEPEVELVQTADGEDPLSKARQLAEAKKIADAKGLRREEPQNLQYSAPSESGGVQHTSSNRGEPKQHSRNKPCYCGSGKKYKLCHGRN